jgi:polygalacturonase
MKTILMLFLLILSSSLVKGKVFNIKDFGAKGDGKTINTSAIQKAINSCRDSGGGKVVLPEGVYISGTLQLFGNINLYLEPGAVLKGSRNISDYYLHSGNPALDSLRLGLIYTENADNVTISGNGDIDGNGDVFADQNRSKVFDSISTQYTRQKNHFREVAHGLGDGPLVPLDRPFQMIIFSNCKNITVTGVLISNSPFWTLHFADCRGVIVSNLRIWNNLMIPNNDGIDITSCSNVLISNCEIITGDDAIAVTGYSHHFDLPGYKKLIHDSENITVTNTYLESRSSAIRIGGWDQNNMKNYLFDNIVISNSNRGINLCVRDKGSIEDMVFSNMVIKTHLHTGDWWGNGEPIHLSAIRGQDSSKLGEINNIKFNHIIAEGESGILLYGTEESIIKNISFDDLTFKLNESHLNPTSGGNFDLRPVIDPKYSMFSHDIPGIFGKYVENIKLSGMEIKWGDVKENYFTNGAEFENFRNLLIYNSIFDPAPVGKKSASVYLLNGSGYRIINSFSSKKDSEFLIKKNVIE